MVGRYNRYVVGQVQMRTYRERWIHTWRKIDTSTGRKLPEQLFLSHIQPHNEVTKLTIARWIKAILNLAGIDINTYRAHSTRAAATSKAESLGF